MHFAAFVAGGYIPFIRHSLLEHLNNTIFSAFHFLVLLFVFLHIVTHILAHYRFCHHSTVLSPNRSTPHNVPKTMYNETDTECATKYTPH